MPNICFLLGGFQGNGGIGRVTSILANELVEIDGVNVTTVSYCQKNQPMLYELSEKINSRFLYSDSISMTKAIIKHHAIKKLTQILKQDKIDVIVACGALFYPLAILAAKKCGIKCFCWEHISPSVKADYNFQGVARKIAVPFADKVIVLTKSAEKYYLENLKIKKDKLTQLYNPVSTEAAKSKEYNSNSKKIISVGRLSYQKNFSLLIDVAADVLPKYPEWSWDIYGRGEEYTELQEKIKTNGLEGRVNLMGQVNDLYERYGDYAFQVMTSRYEGFPMSLIEGAANRLPLISFDIETGPNEIIEDGVNGFLVESENASELAEKIDLLINDSTLREKMSKKSFEIKSQFELDETVERWCQICK